MLEKFGVPYAAHMELGNDKARAIHHAARRLRADQILIGTARQGQSQRKAWAEIRQCLVRGE